MTGFSMKCNTELKWANKSLKINIFKTCFLSFDNACSKTTRKTIKKYDKLSKVCRKNTRATSVTVVVVFSLLTLNKSETSL